MKTFVKIIAYLLVIALFAGIVGIIYKYTNGFNEDFKTFYVEYEGEQILTSQTALELERGKTHTFNVKYTFDTDKTETKDYSVKVLPNMTKDFDYTVNGERYLFSKIKDLTAGFKIDKKENSFDLTIPQGSVLENVLSAYHGGKYIGISQEAIDGNPNPFTLVVSSYNGSIAYNIEMIIEADRQADGLKIMVDGTDVTNKYMHLYSGEFMIDVYAKIEGEWVYVSEYADIVSDIGGEVKGYCLDISKLSISAFDYACLKVSYGGQTAKFYYCTETEGESRWEEI